MLEIHPLAGVPCIEFVDFPLVPLPHLLGPSIGGFLRVPGLKFNHFLTLSLDQGIELSLSFIFLA